MNKIRRKICVFLKLLNKRKKIILCNTPVHENIGDHAIAIAEKEFIQKYFQDFNYIEIEEDICSSKYLPLMLKFVTKSDLIVLQGGGFMGDLWPRHEICMRRIIDLCPDVLKIIFPQTCYLTDNTENAMKEYANSYNNCKNLVFFAREKQSYEFFKTAVLPNDRCFLAPDIVLSLNRVSKNKRNGILICLREDKESLFLTIQRENMVKGIENLKKEIKFTSTIYSKALEINERDKVFEEKLHEFSSSELVITDRLHGMIFAAITGTPCIAFDNLSHKVSGVSEWIVDLAYIKCIDVNQFDNNLIIEMINMKISLYPYKYLNKQFNKFANLIKKIYESR